MVSVGNEVSLTIIAASGLNENNVEEIMCYTRVREVHGSLRSTRPSQMSYRTLHCRLSNDDETEYFLATTDAAKVAMCVANGDRAIKQQQQQQREQQREQTK
eukprot:c8141_g1_i1.p1 GENE.c8141_g1_i1~~c8141_g1_i1.p1  ORF type:complete len:102 (-),score=17.86 c8141_g1_i1:142-447(-)